MPTLRISPEPSPLKIGPEWRHRKPKKIRRQSCRTLRSEETCQNRVTWYHATIAHEYCPFSWSLIIDKRSDEDVMFSKPVILIVMVIQQRRTMTSSYFQATYWQAVACSPEASRHLRQLLCAWQSQPCPCDPCGLGHAPLPSQCPTCSKREAITQADDAATTPHAATSSASRTLSRTEDPVL